MSPGAFMLLAAAAIQWRRTAAWGSAALTAYYALIVVILMNGRLLLTDYAEYGAYSGIAEQLAIAAGGLNRLRCHGRNQNRCDHGQAPHTVGQLAFRCLCAVIRRCAFCL